MTMTTTTAKLSFLALFLLLGAVSQFVAAKPLSHSKLQSPLLQESIIKEINENPEAGWQAAMSPRFSNYTVGDFMHILGVKQIPKKELLGVPVGHCGSCWAFAAVEALSDRFCIQFGKNTSLSVNDLLACCGFMCGNGCDGGIPIYAWRYFVHHGVVTEKVASCYQITRV
ncbi:hypothetical protein ACLB2K_006696 [Fragaria x ananassa]